MLDVETQEQWVDQLGSDRVRALRAKAAPDSWRADEQSFPPDLDSPVNAWERAAVWGARYLAERVVALDADAVLAGAGVANLSAWLGVQLRAPRPARDVQLTAEIGLWGYDATPADPFVLNHRNFPTATMLGDAAMVLGALVGGTGTTTIGCLGGAQIDRFGNVNSTRIDPRPFLVGSGGGNDVASTATENLVVATLTPQRTPADCSYVTSPGRAVRALVTDLGVAREARRSRDRRAGAHRGAGRRRRRSQTACGAAKAACGWDLQVAVRRDGARAADRRRGRRAPPVGPAEAGSSAPANRSAS